MRYRLEDIDAFLHVVEAGSISGAATQLNLSKSVVSKRVADLEQALGVALLNRTTHGVAPTDEGRAFYAHGCAVMERLDAAVEAVSASDGELSGALRITAPTSFGTLYLGPILASFLHQYPGIEATIDLDDRIVELQSSGHDVAIRIAPLPDSSLIARRLCISRRIVCCSPEYAQRQGLPESIDALASHACIGYGNVRSSHIWRFEPDETGGEVRSLTVRSRIVANNGEIMRDAAIAGLGLAVLPAFIAADALADGRLIDAMPGVQPTSDPIHAVHTQTRRSSRKVKAFVEHVQTALEEPLPWASRRLFTKDTRTIGQRS